jgi:hypothetical protein
MGVFINQSFLHFNDTVTKIGEKIFPERKLRSLSPDFYIHISVFDLYIPTIRSAYLLAEAFPISTFLYL